MKHYDLTDWFDHLRGVSPAERRAAMTRHLEVGCGRCRQLLEGLERLAGALAADAAFEPPASAVRASRALFVRYRPERVRSLPRLLVRLVQDSLYQPLPVGVRGNARASRQALYQAGVVFVDLRVEQRPGHQEVALVGQLLLEAASERRPRPHPVVLTAGDAVVTTAVSNDLGEFHLEYVPAGRMRLHIPIEDAARRIEIDLDALLPVREGESQAGWASGRRRGVAKFKR